MSVERVELPPRKHRWDYLNEQRIAASEFEDGNARTKRTCVHCGCVKITVHSGDGRAWREWEHLSGPGVYLRVSKTPLCIAGNEGQ